MAERTTGHHGSDTEDFAGAHSLQQCQVAFQPRRGVAPCTGMVNQPWMPCWGRCGPRVGDHPLVAVNDDVSKRLVHYSEKMVHDGEC